MRKSISIARFLEVCLVRQIDNACLSGPNWNRAREARKSALDIALSCSGAINGKSADIRSVVAMMPGMKMMGTVAMRAMLVTVSVQMLAVLHPQDERQDQQEDRSEK